MYDIKPLEEEWSKYNSKRKRPMRIFFIILFFLLVSFSFLKYNNIDIFAIINKVESEKLKDSTPSLVDINHTNPKEKKKQTLIVVSEAGVVDNTLGTDEDINIIKKPRVHLNIIESSNEEAFDDVAKRFMQTHNIDDSLFLAKSYYNKNDYKKAIYWAFETNKINAEIDESWFILVTSKVKLGHKNEAIAILEKYIKRSNSTDASNLLYKIKKGTL